MIAVSYDFEFAYPILNNRRYPALQIAVTSLSDPDKSLETDAFLDSGAELSLFAGEIATSIGLDLLSGAPKGYSSTAGVQIEARMHRVRLSHADLGNFD